LDASISRSQEVSASRRASIAEKIAREVVKADSTILSLLVLDQREGSRVLAVARSPGLPPSGRASPELVERLGIAATVVWGAAEGAAKLMGRREFIVGAFKEQLVLLVDLREYEMLMAVRLARSSNAEHVYDKIAALLGLS
jgi:hypothetical protein